jgi:hypothetical protein
LTSCTSAPALEVGDIGVAPLRADHEFLAPVRTGRQPAAEELLGQTVGASDVEVPNATVPGGVQYCVAMPLERSRIEPPVHRTRMTDGQVLGASERGKSEAELCHALNTLITAALGASPRFAAYQPVVRTLFNESTK